jgi:membrane-bound ClpP family serine protease
MSLSIALSYLLDDHKRTRSMNQMNRLDRNSLNWITLAIFAPVLILVGIAGFLIPAEYSLTSGAPAYNIFHLVFGCIGLFLVWRRNELWLALFNTGFGLIDLYQAVASVFHLPPEQYFLWTKVDDIVHVAIGLALVTIGCYGLFKNKRA